MPENEPQTGKKRRRGRPKGSRSTPEAERLGNHILGDESRPSKVHAKARIEEISQEWQQIEASERVLRATSVPETEVDSLKRTAVAVLADLCPDDVDRGSPAQTANILNTVIHEAAKLLTDEEHFSPSDLIVNQQASEPHENLREALKEIVDKTPRATPAVRGMTALLVRAYPFATLVPATMCCNVYTRSQADLLTLLNGQCLRKEKRSVRRRPKWRRREEQLGSLPR